MTVGNRPAAGGRRLVLASASARRRDLLSAIGVSFVVRPADVDETPRPGEGAVHLVERLSRTKATAVAADPGEVVVAADTVVEVDGTVLGKPADAGEAASMLRALSGRTHRVLTGMTVRVVGDLAGSGHPIGPNSGVRSATATTDVTFTPLTEDDIAWYVGTGEPFDKAGAYAIQGAGGLFVASIRGSHHNVVGLPLAALSSLLADVGVDLRSLSR